MEALKNVLPGKEISFHILRLPARLAGQSTILELLTT
jgi:hypothetical protein